MIKTFGSQKREKIEDTDYVLVSIENGTALLFDDKTGKCETWQENDHFAGYVIEINGIGYEFVTSA